MMFMLAMLWSVALINAGMIGTTLEALIGRVARLWLLVPLGRVRCRYFSAMRCDTRAANLPRWDQAARSGGRRCNAHR